QHLSIEPTNDPSQCALNSINAKCRSGYRSATPPPINSQITCCGIIGPYTHCVIIRLDADFPVIGWFTCSACDMTTLSVVDSGSLIFTPPVCVWMNTCTPLACAAAQTGSKSRE